MDEPKLIRLEMEFDDGRIQSLEGEEATKWLEAVNGITTVAYVHGSVLPPFLWRERAKEKPHA